MKAKSSRKGKKEWRRNISSEEHDLFLENSAEIERSGGVLADVPDAQIFYVDKTQDKVLQRKVDKYRNKVLYTEKVFQRNSLIPVVAWPERKIKKSKKPVHESADSKAQTQLAAPVPSEPLGGKLSVADPWDERGGEEASTSRKSKVSLKTEKSHLPAPAVQVDLPGCSFNPSFEDHQDALGMAVAEEVRKELQRELQPEAPPLTLEGPSSEMGPLSEEDVYFLEVGPYQEEEAEEQEEDNGDLGPPVVSKPVEVKRLTRADLNRRLRRREAQAEEEKRRSRKRERRELERLKEIGEELEEDLEEKEMRRARREAAREEKMATLPPKLGPHKFEADPIKVLLTEEVNGSLRKLKGCSTLARERFKSFQRRGLLEPRLPVKRRKAKNRKSVVQGSKGQREKEQHLEIQALKAAQRANQK